MLPLVQSLANSVIGAAVQGVADEGKTVSCKAGCAACCRQVVPIAESEARRIRDLVNDLPEPRRTVIRERFAEARRRLVAAGLWQQMDDRAAWPDGESYNRFGMAYFNQGVACPFLEDESCSIHPDRPVSCREYLVTSPAAHCANPSAQTIEIVPLPAKVWTALARLDPMPPGAKFIRWVPLVQAPDWADAHPEEPTERPGTEWLKELLDHLTNRKTRGAATTGEPGA